jgi:hypothetical protein
MGYHDIDEGSLDYLYRSSKYISRTYDLLSDKLRLKVDVRLPVEFFSMNILSVQALVIKTANKSLRGRFCLASFSNH